MHEGGRREFPSAPAALVTGSSGLIRAASFLLVQKKRCSPWRPQYLRRWLDVSLDTTPTRQFGKGHQDEEPMLSMELLRLIARPP